MGKMPKIIAHRGGAKNNIENTITAFDYAYSLKRETQRVGSDIEFETDVRLTKDKQLLVFHDEDLKRLTQNNSKIINLTLKEIRTIWERKFPTYPLLTFDEMLERYPDVSRIYVEVKDRNIAFEAGRILIETIIKHKAQKKVVITTEFEDVWNTIFNLKHELNALIKQSAPHREARQFLIKAKFFIGKINRHSDTLDLPIKHGENIVFDLLTKRVIKKAKEVGYELSYWDWWEHPITKKHINFMIKNQVYGIMVDDLNMTLECMKTQK